MSTVVGVLEHNLWLRSKSYSSERKAGRYLNWFTNKRVQMLHDLGLSSDSLGLPASVMISVCPNLGMALFHAKELPPTDLLRAVSRCAHIKFAEESSYFEVISPVSGYEELSTLGAEIPTWHHELVGIDRLHHKNITGQGVQVAILDSGVDMDVSSLSGKIVAHASFENDVPVIGGPLSDPFKHGTHVSGIIAGRSIGVAPDASLVVCQIARDGTTSFHKMVLALEWLCADFPQLRVINMSVGRLDDPSPALRNVVLRLLELNKVLVCAIGNDGEGTSRTPGNLPEAIGVGAVNITRDVPAFSSGFTSEEPVGVRSKPDLVMPGVSIPSCIPGGQIVAASGTSQAAPMASGLLALMLQDSPALSAPILRSKLLDLCVDLPVPPSRDGYGLPDASIVAGF